jgi:PAS domain S-box-containing protein
MEQKLFEELEKSKSALRTQFQEKLTGKVSDNEIEFILGSIDRCIMGMVQVMKEGKSIHEKFFSDIILNSIDAIIGIDNDEKIFLWNKGAETMMGYAKEEILGRNWEVIIPDRLRRLDEIGLMKKEIEKKGFISNYETERLTKDDRIINVSVTRYILYNEEKKVLGSVGIVRNITKEKQLERVLREKENLALIGEVVSSIAHNLSNPLNIISGNADYLLLDKDDKSEGFEELKIILDETTRITKSIRQILNFSKPVNLTIEECHIDELISSVIERSKFLIKNKKIIFEKKFARDLPSVKIDKEQMSDVFLNIINNGIQAITFEGTIKVKISKNPNSVITEISDTGSGIPSNNLEKIFKPFFSTKEYGKGTGLGLAFADRIVKEHRGKIEVKSSIGKGSTFIISLPV